MIGHGSSGQVSCYNSRMEINFTPQNPTVEIAEPGRYIVNVEECQPYRTYLTQGTWTAAWPTGHVGRRHPLEILADMRSNLRGEWPDGKPVSIGDSEKLYAVDWAIDALAYYAENASATPRES